MSTLRSQIRSLTHSDEARTMLGQNGIRVIDSAASPSTNGEVFQNLKAIEDCAFTADYVKVGEGDTDTSIDITLQAGDVLPGAWHNINVASGTLIAYF